MTLSPSIPLVIGCPGSHHQVGRHLDQQSSVKDQEKDDEADHDITFIGLMSLVSFWRLSQGYQAWASQGAGLEKDDDFAGLLESLGMIDFGQINHNDKFSNLRTQLCLQKRSAQMRKQWDQKLKAFYLAKQSYIALKCNVPCNLNIDLKKNL